MRAADLRVGDEYAFRKGRQIGTPFIRVRLVQYAEAKRQAQIEHVEGDLEGLKEWVQPKTLHCDWKAVDALRRQESKARDLEASPDATHLPSAVAEAANIVFAASGEDVYLDERGLTEVERDAVERVAHRAHLEDEQVRAIFVTPAYRDASGGWHLPCARLLPLAHRFATAEAGLVNMYIDDEIAQYRERGYQTGERFMHQILIEKGPAYALAREWAGANNVADDLRADNERLRRLVHEAVSLLRARGHERDAARFERALRGG